LGFLFSNALAGPTENIWRVKVDAAAASNVKHASETLETESLQLSNQVTEFLGKIRAA
jgi:hypothetical protein